jgi:hypothetical protein
VGGGVALPGPLGDPPRHQGSTGPGVRGLVRRWLAGRGGKGSAKAAPVTTSGFLTEGGTSRRRTRTPTAPTPAAVSQGTCQRPAQRAGASCANSAAAPGAPESPPRPFTCFKPARSQDENAQFVISDWTCPVAGRGVMDETRSLGYSASSLTCSRR